jgi:hypothetical protein
LDVGHSCIIGQQGGNCSPIALAGTGRFLSSKRRRSIFPGNFPLGEPCTSPYICPSGAEAHSYFRYLRRGPSPAPSRR